MEQQEAVKKILDEMFSRMGFSVEVLPELIEDDHILMNVKTDEAGFLIGYEGGNLEALQHVARVLAGKKLNQTVPFLLDVNDYRKNRIEFLRNLSKNIAQKAVAERAAITLQPMPAFERRIIHSSLTGEKNVSTESIGEEPNRRVVVKANQ